MRVLELFAGYGSQALALENLGIEFTSDISEIDKYAIQAYNQLHGETHNWGDITKINEKELPYYDLITYSFPCQDISLAGLQKGLDSGSETRSSLLWECERIIRAAKPKYLLMENVKNLVGEKHKHNFIKWLRVLETIGYQNWWQVLNAKDYGVPQNRERVFVVSILGGGQYLFPNKIKSEKRLKDVLEPVVNEKYYLSNKIVEGFLRTTEKQKLKNGGFTFEPTDGNCIAKTLTTKPGQRTVDNYIQESLICADRKTDTQPRIIQIGNLINTDRFGGNPQNGRIYNINGVSPTLRTMQGGGLEPKILQERFFKQAFETMDKYNAQNGDTIDAFNQRVNNTGISPTLTTRPEGFKTAILPVQNYRIRKLTPLECWRLMGVKDEQFNKLHDISNSQLYKLAGNSIVVDVLMGIFKNMFLENDSKGQLTLL